MPARLLPATLLLALPAFVSPAAEPVPVSLFTCSDPDLEVTVWASTPLFYNPTNIDVDKDGCVWVAEGVNYRKHFDRKPEGDRIMVLRDNDGDGKADESWPFVQEPFLRAPLGVAVIGNKIVVSMAPDLVVYTDKDGDKKFDPAKGDTREVLLTGFNGRNHDHSCTASPSGLTGNGISARATAGRNSRTNPAKPSASDPGRIPHGGRKTRESPGRRSQ